MLQLPVTVAFTVKVPDVEFAVRVEVVAIPFELVMSVSVDVPLPAKIAVAPDDGAVKVTEMPGSGASVPSTTFAVSGKANGDPTTVVCGVPPTAWTTAGTPAPAVLVRIRLALGPAEIDAVTSYCPTMLLAVNWLRLRVRWRR